MAINSSELNDIAQLLPTVFIEQITLDSKFYNAQDGNFKENLILSISLSLKDTVDKDGISQWFFENELDFKKYIKVHPLIIRTRDVLQGFYTLTGDYDYETLSSLFNNNPDITEIKGVEIPTKEDLTISNSTTFTENYISDNDDGTKEITVPLRFTHETIFDKEKNKFLAVLVFLTFDLKAFVDALGITDTDITEENALSRSYTSQVIIENGEIVSESKYFKLSDGSFYYGQFHVISDNNGITYKTGVIETEDSVPLELVTDKNYIINDLRVRKYFQYKDQFDINGSVDITDTQKLDTTSATNNIFKSELQIKKILDKTKTNKKEFSKYFSDTFVSLDEQGNCRFSFFFDRKAFALDNSFYPIIFQKDSNALAQKIKVKNIRVYRIRKDIKEINSYSENIPVLIAKNSTDPSYAIDILQPPNPDLYNGSYITENNIEGSDSLSIRNYSVCDTYVSKINYGLYKYMISMEIVDSTSDDLLEKLKSLNEIRTLLKSYYEKDCLSGKKIEDGVFGDAKYKQNKVKYVPYFDVMLGKFIPDFLKDKNNIINQVIASFTTFLDISKNLGYYSFNSQEEEQKFTDQMYNLLKPPSATPESVSLAVNVVDDVINKLQDLLDISDTQKASNTSSKYKNNIISFDYIFENSSVSNIENSTEYDFNKSYDSFFNAAVINGVGYKVVNGTSDDLKFGINSIKLADYKKLTDFISQKYFEQYTTFNLKDIYGQNLTDTYNFVDQFDNDDSKFRYLPVSVVNTIDLKFNILKLSDQFYNQEYYENIFMNILNYNLLKQTNFSNQETNTKSQISINQQKIKAQLLGLFTNSSIANISIAPEESITTTKTLTSDQSFYNTLGTQGIFDTNKLDKQVPENKNIAITSTSDINARPNSLLLEILLHEIVNKFDDLRDLKDYSIFVPIDENENKNNKFFIDKFVSLVSKLYGDSKVPDAVIQKYIRDLPIPIKHLLISRGNTLGIIKAFEDSNDIKDATIYPENFFKYWINFKNLYQIEYFANFENGNNLKSPNWQPLTINKLENSTGNILCRIQKHKLPFFNEYFPNVDKLEMPLFDKYFYIIPDDSINLLSDIQKAIQQMPKPLPPIEVQEANPPPDKAGPISILETVSQVADIVASVVGILNNLEVVTVASPQTMVGFIAPMTQEPPVVTNNNLRISVNTTPLEQVTPTQEAQRTPEVSTTNATSLNDLVSNASNTSGGNLPKGTGGASSGTNKSSQNSNQNLQQKKKQIADKFNKFKK